MALIPAPLIDTSLQELAPILRSQGFWAGLLGLALVLGVAGPFGTAETLPLLPRMIYWCIITLSTGAIGFVLGFVGCDLFHALGLPKWLASLVSGSLTGLPIIAIVFTVNAVLLAPGDLALNGLPLALSIMAISSVLSLATYIAFFAAAPAAAAPAPLPHYSRHPRLMDRLPTDLRAPLVALTATNHYTEVTTTTGTTRLLLRLSDAIAEAAPTPGLRIHRSHWVATDQITASRRDGPRALVTLSDGRTYPVSRSYVRRLEQTGLLSPR
jgi:hypothetical protein